MSLIDPVTLSVFLVVGVIVSLDVTGLTLSHSAYFQRHPERIRRWAWSNACWHAGLLAVYIFAISVTLEISVPFLGWLRDVLVAVMSLFEFLRPDIAQYVDLVIGVLGDHASIILGLITLYIVWDTYKGKIASEPELGDREQLPRLAKVVFDLLDLGCRCWPLNRLFRVDGGSLSQFLHWQAQAALVAVDMLALAALMKSMGYLETGTNQLLLVGIVLFVVRALAAIAAGSGASAVEGMERDAAAHAGQPGVVNIRFTRKWLIVVLRLLEPLLILYFAIELMAFLIFGQHHHTVGFIGGAALLLAALVRNQGFYTIVEKSLAAADDPGTGKPPPLRDMAQIRADLLELLGTIGKWLLRAVGIIAFVIFLLIVFYDSPDDVVSLEGEISRLIQWMSLVLAVAIFAPNRGIVRWVTAGLQKLHDSLAALAMERRFQLVAIPGAIAAAALFPVWDRVTDPAVLAALIDSTDTMTTWSRLGFRPNHVHALQFALWPVTLLLIGLFCVAVRSVRPDLVEAGGLRRSARAGLLVVVGGVFYGAALCQDLILQRMMPYVDTTNGARPPEHPPLVPRTDPPLRGRTALVYGGFVDYGYGLASVTSTLVRAGASVRVTRTHSAGQLSRELADADVLVIPEQLGIYAADRSRARLSRLAARCAELAPAVTAWARQPGATVVALEGDRFTAPGAAALRALGLGELDVVKTPRRADLDVVNWHDPLLDPLSGWPSGDPAQLSRSAGGMVFRGGDGFEPVVVLARDSSQWVVATRRLGGGEIVVIGFDFHAAREFHETLLVNACRKRDPRAAPPDGR